MSTRPRKLPRRSPTAAAEPKLMPPGGLERRGLFSCLYSGGCDGKPSSKKFTLWNDVIDSISDYYKEAFRRLPMEDMPPDAADQLTKSMAMHGLSLGLLDPVSNIILNTMALLPRHHFLPDDAGATTTTTTRRRSNRNRDTSWHGVSSSSLLALCRFILSYFGSFLSEEKATRYLH